ncbi:MAG: carbon starvation CstA family protein [Planctomycetota bacterium]|nr:carbon starvation CstA family protein [Planctomycetota bacterium]
MTILCVLVLSAAVFVLAGRFYSRFLARSVGEDVSRITPAIQNSDGCDYVPTPTPVVFAHHFASIAGAGPIVGPVIAIIYGWLPALVWVVFGSVLIGAVHDYLATYMSARSGGQSVATIARRMLGGEVFVAMTIFLVVMLALVCATFLNLSAAALTSMLPFDRLELPASQTLFRVVGEKVVIGGIASMSVIVITAVAPLLGWLYIRKKVAVWKCSLLAIAICTVSITIGVFYPVAFPEQVHILGLTLTGRHIWMFLLSAYVLVAAGVPVWIFLQSRDFINVHILYVGMGVLFVTLLVAGFRAPPPAEPIPPLNIAEGTTALGVFWPTLFIVIACGAVSGFHSLCAGGTTCKQITSERAARQVGYYGMLLEGFLAVCVISVLVIGVVKSDYIRDVHPSLVGVANKSNAVLGFAMAVGNAAKLAFGVPVAVGALAGMVLLEGFLVTTLDTAIRLTRYLIEEIWRTFFAAYDNPAASAGPGRWLWKLLRQYWFNSSLAVALTLAFALTGGVKALWGIFATANQLLAAMVLSLAALWLLRQGKRVWFVFLPAVAMLVTTATNLVLMLKKFLQKPAANATLLTADIVIMLITLYLFIAGVRAAVSHFGQKRRA